MQSPLCKSQSLKACCLYKAPPKHVPKLPASFIGNATPSKAPGFGCIKHRAKKDAQAKNEPMATISENSTTVEEFPKVQPPVFRREGPAKAPSLDTPREDAYAKHAPTSARAEILDIEE